MSRTLIQTLVERINPCDGIEAEHRRWTLSWIASGAPLYRTSKPATPDPHLVVYFLPVDVEAQAALLVDHRAAARWLPPGGHLELDEDPAGAVRRELREELGWEAKFFDAEPSPLMVTVNRVTDLTGGHTDVSLWYAVRASVEMGDRFDPEEHGGSRWFRFEALPFERSDPHLGRFIRKFQRAGD